MHGSMPLHYLSYILNTSTLITFCFDTPSLPTHTLCTFVWFTFSLFLHQSSPCLSNQQAPSPGYADVWRYTYSDAATLTRIARCYLCVFHRAANTTMATHHRRLQHCALPFLFGACRYTVLYQHACCCGGCAFPT